MKKIFLKIFLLILFLSSCSYNSKINQKPEKQKYIYSAIWCPSCNERIDEIVAKKENNITIVFYPFDFEGRNIKEEILKYVKEKNIKNKVIIDENLKIKSQFKIETVPFEY